MSDSTLFIPDISGFTKFVKSTEISHSKHIIEELITIIIDQGKKEFEVAEVEGDAVFFYKEKIIAPEGLVRNAKHMFIAFHKHLLDYEHNRICDCGACTSAVNLRLKFISHSGDISLANFGTGHSKPFGDAVIVAHRLLKNQIPLDEYILFTDHFFKQSDLKLDGTGAINDDSLGEIAFKYLAIDHWKSEVVLDKKELKKEHVDFELSASDEIAVDAQVLHQFISDFKYRHYWNKDADQIVFDEQKINQAGAEHYCVIDGKNLFFDTIKPDFDEGLSYGEILKNPAPLGYLELNFFLNHISSAKTGIKIVIRASLKWKLQRLMLPVIRKKMSAQATKTIQSIKDAVLKYSEGEIAA